MRCIAIDDEPIALNIISEFARRMGNISVETFTNPLKALEEIRRSKPDIVFIDIEMKGMNGLELARIISSDVMFIFTTAYAQFALDGFELNAIDFLHKPFSFNRFEGCGVKGHKAKGPAGKGAPCRGRLLHSEV